MDQMRLDTLCALDASDTHYLQQKLSRIPVHQITMYQVHKWAKDGISVETGLKQAMETDQASIWSQTLDDLWSEQRPSSQSLLPQLMMVHPFIEAKMSMMPKPMIGARRLLFLETNQRPTQDSMQRIHTLVLHRMILKSPEIAQVLAKVRRVILDDCQIQMTLPWLSCLVLHRCHVHTDLPVVRHLVLDQTKTNSKVDCRILTLNRVAWPKADWSSLRELYMDHASGYRITDSTLPRLEVLESRNTKGSLRIIGHRSLCRLLVHFAGKHHLHLNRNHQLRVVYCAEASTFWLGYHLQLRRVFTIDCRVYNMNPRINCIPRTVYPAMRQSYTDWCMEETHRQNKTLHIV